jgi:hypothetical protein
VLDQIINSKSIELFHVFLNVCLGTLGLGANCEGFKFVTFSCWGQFVYSYLFFFRLIYLFSFFCFMITRKAMCLYIYMLNKSFYT